MGEEVESVMEPVRAAVVTGGSQGIGRRTAELLAERGFRLAIVDLKDPKLADVIGTLKILRIGA